MPGIVGKDDELMRLKTCSNCLNKIATDFAFCRWCGEKQVVTLQKYLAEYETRKLDNTQKSYITSPLNSQQIPKETVMLAGETLELPDTKSARDKNYLPEDFIRSVVNAIRSGSLKMNNILRKAVSNDQPHEAIR